MDLLRGKIYLVVSNWSYPFGGGEEFLYQSMDWAKNLGMKCYWISFSKPNNKPHEKFEIIETENGRLLNLTGGFDEKTLLLWLKIIKPDIVHHQGNLRLNFYNSCELLRINFMSGFHFWIGGIILDEKCKNINILENSEKHKMDPEFELLLNKKFCYIYSVSKFVNECFKKINNYEFKHVIYSGSSIKKCKINNFNPIRKKYVTIINIHKFKGGELLLYLLNNLKNVSFLGVKTEYGSEELDDVLEKKIKELNLNDNDSIIINRVNDPKIIFQETKIFLAPSVVDETFCRTVNEAMMNGIPVITTGQGNIKYLVGEQGYMYDIQDKESWKNKIQELYFDDEKYNSASKYFLDQFNNYSENISIKQFNTMVYDIIKKSKCMNVMLLTPWCDQGLGIQSRNYYNILKDEGYNVSVFALKPYNANSSLDLQKNKAEWEIDNVYYSPNDREHVLDFEFNAFIEKYNIGKALIPETCWFRIFQVAKFLRSKNVQCYAIPNIEIVRKDELFKHSYFYKILCNNYLCQNIFNKYGIMTTEYIGYGVACETPFGNTKKIDNIINFLFIGGMNAFSRKQILSICEAFDIAYKKSRNIRLTCTIQNTNSLESDDKSKIEQYLKHEGITIIQDHLTYKKIMELYDSHHVSIQVSKHEGLGLGFYEAITTRTPIITLDTPPHNEIIRNNVNGWTIPCFYKKMLDNKDPIFDSAYFKPSILADKILEIYENRETYDLLLKSLNEDLNSRLSLEIFKKKFINALNE